MWWDGAGERATGALACHTDPERARPRTLGYKYSKEDILKAALESSLEDGVGGLTFGRVARRMGIADRTVVYYFPTKQVLIQGVIEAHSAHLQRVLAQAFDQPASDCWGLVRAAWPVMSSPEADPVMRLFFEIIGMSIRGVEPFCHVVAPALRAWVGSLEPLLHVPPSRRQAEAEAALAVIDGLLLLHFTAGEDVAARAFERLT